MAALSKARYWWAVLYPENMIPDWQTKIDDILQLPFAYCLHHRDKDSKSDHRKDHIHLIIVFPNTTTYKHALEVFGSLSLSGKNALNTCESIIGIRNAYDYLIHDTDGCRKNGKELYLPEERITGNNFDIGAFEQLSLADRNKIIRELCQVIVDNGISNFVDFYCYVIQFFEDTNYFDTLKTYSGLFERLCKGNYHKFRP